MITNEKNKEHNFIFCNDNIFNVYAATLGDKLTSPEDGWTRYDDTNENIVYLVTWDIDNLVDYYGGSVNYAISDGKNKIKFNFKGSKLRLIADIYNNKCKQVMIKIDNILAGEYNQYCEAGIPQVLVFEVNDLNNKEHIIEIVGDDEGYFNIDAIDTDGELLPYITQPINLTATSSIDSITLNWDAVDRTDSYIILRKTTADSINKIIASKVTETTYIDNDIEAGVTYYYVVRAVKDGVESSDSNVASAMVEKTNPAVLQIKLSTTDIYEYRITMNEVDNFINWYTDRLNGTGLPFYKFAHDSNIEPYTDSNEYLIFNKIVRFKVKEYLQ